MALQPASQTAMYNQRRQNRAYGGAGGSTTTAPVRPTEGAQGAGKNYYDYNANQPGTTRPAATPSGYGSGSGVQASNWTPTSPPGYGENWYAANAYKYDHPSSAYQYWQGTQGNYANPTMYENQLGNYSNQLGGTSGAMENLYNQMYGQGQFTNPSAGENWWQQYGGQYGAPSAGEQTLGNVAGQLGSQSGQMEDWARQNGMFFQNPGDMEKFFQANGDVLQNNNNLAGHQGTVEGNINAAQNSQGFFSGAAAPQLADPGYTEQMAMQYRPENSYNEDFLLGGGATEGLDSLYDRLYQQGSRRLGNEGAARGTYNSGASLRSAEELNADLGAQHVRDYMTASNAADQSKMARLAEGRNLMQGADQSLTSRLSTGMQGAASADASDIARARAGQDLYSGISNEKMANLGMAGNWANQSQAGGLARMSEGANVANDANSQWLSRLRDEASAGNMQASQFLSRLNGGSEAASRATGDWATRMGMGQSYAQNSQQDWMQRLRDAGGMQKDLQGMMMDRLGQGMDQAGAADAGYWNALTQGQAAADAAQNMQQNRENNVFNNVNTLGHEQATTYQTGTNQAMDEKRQSLMDEINGILAQGGISSDEIMNKYGEAMASMGLIIQGGKVVASSMAGNPKVGGSSNTESDFNLNNSAITDI